MLVDFGFYDRTYNPEGRGYENYYHQRDSVVIDQASGLMWQRFGSPNPMHYKNAKQYIDQINRDGFAGYSDWRLPTLEEAMSLMEPEKKNGDMYIDPVFDKTQSLIWTSDLISASAAWRVYFRYGFCGNVDILGNVSSVRAVRSRH